MEDNTQFSVSLNEADDHVKINADSLASSLRASMSSNFSFSKKCCIFKIPNILRRHNPEAFVPKAFSIGPWHHGRGEHLKQGEEFKLNYLRRLMSRFPEKKLEQLIQAIGKIEEESRAHYAGPIEMRVDDFIKLLIIDGCFIIEVFRNYGNHIPNPYSSDEYDPIVGMSCMIQYLFHDLILLENQIPWSVLELLFNETMELESPSLEHLGIKFFMSVFSSTAPPLLSPYRGKKHVLDLIREWLVSQSYDFREVKKGQKPVWEAIPSAQRLKEAGIEFKRSDSMNILNVMFVHGVLVVPSLVIQETTEVIFRNIISFEQGCTECLDKITSYAVLLHGLINTKKDLKILCDAGIIENWLNPEAATQFFKELSHDAYLTNYYYRNLCLDVNIYRRFRWRAWRAWYLQNLLSPWAIVSQLIGAVVLILTCLQALFSIIK